MDYSQNFQKNKHSKEEDRKTQVSAISKDLDLRNRWLGIEELRSKYNPTPYHNKTKEGEHIKLNERAQKTAECFSKEHWGEPSQEQKDVKESRRHKFRNNEITTYRLFGKYSIGEITIEELKSIAK